MHACMFFLHSQYMQSLFQLIRFSLGLGLALGGWMGGEVLVLAQCGVMKHRTACTTMNIILGGSWVI